MSVTLPPLLRIPSDIYVMINEYITSPRDYFHLAQTCRSLWAYEDPLYVCVVLDARILWANIISGPGSSERRWPPGYEPLLYWCLRRRQPAHIVARIVERYYWVYPEAVRGSRTSALRPASIYAMAADHLAALRVMLDMRVIPSLAESGDQYMDWAVEMCGDLSIPRWIAENGVPVAARHMFALDRRGLASSPSAEWQWFWNRYISASTANAANAANAGGTSSSSEL